MRSRYSRLTKPPVPLTVAAQYVLLLTAGLLLLVGLVTLDLVLLAAAIVPALVAIGPLDQRLRRVGKQERR